MKIRRQRKILEVIENENISTQEELADALRKAGYDVTQATVSRDIKELRLAKIATGNNSYRYGLPKEQGYVKNEDRLRRMMQELVISIDFSGNMIILRTYPGNAHTIAALIDGAEWGDVMGTLAGDDTILLIIKQSKEVPPSKEVGTLLDKLKSLME